MGKVQILDEITINQIAAGEVVERPASVVKELVENAIDANATRIVIEIKEGGLSYIRISDDGEGFAYEDIAPAFLRHATSKIRTVDDLSEILSLGFRGEALASVASVSQVELMTKTAELTTGYLYVIDGGVEKEFVEIGCPNGSTFVIRNLFFNTPARKKFLKSPKTESAYIADIIEKIALGHPEISFKLIIDKKVRVETSGTGRLRDTIFQLYNKEVAKELIGISYEAKDITLKVEGFLGKPSISRGNRSYENYYLHGRYIKSQVLEKAIEKAYEEQMMLHQYPFCVLFIELDLKFVDVNVHPTKMEVRFHDESSLFDALYRGILETLKGTQQIPETTFSEKNEPDMEQVIEPEILVKPEPELAPEPAPESETETEPEPEPEVLYDSDENRLNEVLKPLIFNEAGIASLPVKEEPVVEQVAKSYLQGEQLDYKKSTFSELASLKEHKVVGQLFDTYWIVELKDKFYLIDQHAAHEKVLYEKLVKELALGHHHQQLLLEPMVVQLSLLEYERYEMHKVLFLDLGFDIEDFGGHALIVKAVPFIFNQNMAPTSFIEMLDGLGQQYQPNKYESFLHDMATMACKAAIKANDRLELVEYHRLIDDLLRLDDPFHCPHGRPVIIAMTQYELEKKFKRIV